MVGFEDGQDERAERRPHPVLLVVIVMVGVTAVAMPVPRVVSAARQKPCGGDVDDQPENRDRDRLGEADRHRGEQTYDRLVADQDGDHGQDDRAGEPGKVAQLSRPESVSVVVRVLARIGVGESRQQQGASMRRHVQHVRDQGDGPEGEAADHLERHHRPA